MGPVSSNWHSLGQNLSGQNEIDASGCMVLPGLIDCHVHVYEHCTQLGVNADDNCLARGLTLQIYLLDLVQSRNPRFDIQIKMEL